MSDPRDIVDRHERPLVCGCTADDICDNCAIHASAGAADPESGTP
jgi:hypothetical protein